VRAATGLAADALAEFREAEAIYQALADVDSTSLSARFARNGLADAKTYAADVLRGLGRLDEARAGYATAISLLEGPAPADPEYDGARLAYSVRGLGLVLQSTGDVAGAAAAARRALALYEALPRNPWNDLFRMACVRSALAGLAGLPRSGIPAAEAGPEADRAMALLFQAMEQKSLNPALMRAEAALDHLRPRTDFQLLLMDLAMPAQPFAR
jgi:tetratricopeptide (TPR) repeat protein